MKGVKPKHQLVQARALSGRMSVGDGFANEKNRGDARPQPMLELALLRYPRFVGVQFLAPAPAYA
jgi:hypothetical protein